MARLLAYLLALVPLLSAALVNAQSFTMQPADQVVKEGASSAAEIICAVQNLNTVTKVLSFKIGSSIISDSSVFRNDVLTNTLGLDPGDFLINQAGQADGVRKYSLFVKNLKRAQSGNYSCVVCGNVNSKCNEMDIILQSDVGRLEVAYPPVPPTATCSIQSETGNTQISLDEHVTLSCVSGSAVPAVILKWTRDGQDTSSDISYESENTRATFALTAQNSDDGAVFACQLSYTNGIAPEPGEPDDDISDSCSLSALNVVSLPDISVESSQPINVGQQAVFTCTFASRTSTFSTSAIQWTVPNEFDANRYTVSTSKDASVLTITSVQSGDHGAFLTCSATDEDGISNMASKMLLITGLPTPTLPNTAGTTTSPPSTTPAPFPLGAIIALVIGGLIIAVLVCAFITWYCVRHPRKSAAKQAGATSLMPMNNTSRSQAMPDKVPNHKLNHNSEGKDYPDDKAMGDPDVIPREKRGGHPDDVDPSKWWRDTMPPTDGTPNERSGETNDYPTIKGMKMPFQDRSSPYMNMEGKQGYNSLDNRDYAYQHYDDRNFSDSGYREPRYDDGGYENPQAKDHQYESAKFQGRDEEKPQGDFDYDNEAYQRSFNGQADHDRPDVYDDQYNGHYNDHYDDHYNDDRPDDRYDDRPDEHYDDRPDERYDQYYDDQPDMRYDDQPDDRDDDRYGRPDGQEQYDMPPDRNEDYYPSYDQDERIPDGHSSSNDHNSAPYDDRDPYGPSFDDHPSDPYNYSEGYSSKHDYNDDDLRNSQGTPSYV